MLTDAQKAAQEILQMLQRFGVKYINAVLFEGKSPEELEELKSRVRSVIDRHMC